MLRDLLASIPLIRLLQRGSTKFDRQLVALVVVSGLASAGLLAIINAAANGADQENQGRLLATFALTLAVYIYAQRWILFTAITEVERLLNDIRVRIADRIRQTELEALDQVGRAEIFGIVSRETQNISQAASTLITALQSLMMVFFSISYIAILSKTAFFITVGMIWLGLLLHFRGASELSVLLNAAQQKENEFLRGLTHLLDGFKEARMSRPRSADLFQHVRAISAAVADVKTKAGTRFSAHYVLTQAMLYGLMASIVFLLPRLSPSHADVVPRLTAAILFVIGPLTAIVGAVGLYSTANVAALNIFSLEERLEQSTSTDLEGRPDAPTPATFSTIELRHTLFQYADRGKGTTFRFGPIDLAINAGQIVFIVGGNGSGKSTFLKLLTGLYHAQSGAIVMDGTLVTPDTASWYRSHFSPIFGDYYLFDRLYGLGPVSPERVNELLKMMRIEDKTTFHEGGFTNLDLSSGQRKRLALIVALLENRPILVLDEWAADQDPQFRQYFYEVILPDLKRQGKTIIAATHDDRYFGTADRVLKMEYGEMSEHTASSSRAS
jgi:putative pyoverdin transport system ATP-binding/permease protein